MPTAQAGVLTILFISTVLVILELAHSRRDVHDFVLFQYPFLD